MRCSVAATRPPCSTRLARRRPRVPRRPDGRAVPLSPAGARHAARRAAAARAGARARAAPARERLAPVGRATSIGPCTTRWPPETCAAAADIVWANVAACGRRRPDRRAGAVAEPLHRGSDLASASARAHGGRVRAGARPGPSRGALGVGGRGRAAARRVRAARSRRAVALMRAAIAGDGPARMRDGRAGGPTSCSRPAAPAARSRASSAGVASHLLEERDEATRRLEEGARDAAVRAPHVHALCLAQLAVLALERGDWDEVTELSTRARGAGRPARAAPRSHERARVRGLRGGARAPRADRGGAARPAATPRASRRR